MRGIVTAAGVLLAVSAGAVTLVLREPYADAPPAPDDGEPAVAQADRPPSRSRSRRDRVRVAPRRPQTKAPDPLERLLADVRALAAAGRPLDALERLRVLAKEHPEHADAEAFHELLRELERETVAWLGRALPGLPADVAADLASRVAAVVTDNELRRELMALLAATREDVRSAEGMVLAGTRTAAEREALERHLARFGPDLDGVSRDGPSEDLDKRLDAVRRRYRGSKRPVKPLPVARPDEVEQRRLEQLEKLRQRGAVGLLDHIHSGLAWLALHQSENGGIADRELAERCKSLGHRPECTKGQRSSRFDLAATALTVLAFLDFRDQDAQGLFEPSLANGVSRLLAQQKPDGSLPGHNYSAGIALMALGQAASASGDPKVLRAVERAWEFYTAHRGPLGGYRYSLGSSGDLSVTGWYVQAFETARDAGAKLPPGVASNLDEFVRASWIGDRRFAYTPGSGARRTLEPVGMLSLLILTDELDEGLRADWAEHLASVDRGKRLNLYTLYYDVRVELALAGELSEARRRVVFDFAKYFQRSEGESAGMFDAELRRVGTSKKKADPEAPVVEGPTRWMGRGGPAVFTAFSVLTLEHALYRR